MRISSPFLLVVTAMLAQRVTADPTVLEPGATCPSGSQPLTSSWENCKAAAEALGFSGDSVAHVDYLFPWGTSRPQGCYRSAGNGRFHFNTGEGGNFEAGDSILCEIIPTSPSGGGNGDPHYKKWDGQWFDFHGICDQILTRSPSFANGLGLDIHIRTKPRYQYSYIEATAIKIGTDILQIGSFGEYWFNGVESVKLPFTMGNRFVVDRVLDSKKHQNFVITLDKSKKESIAINVFKDMVSVNVENATVANFGTSSGLLGSFPGGVMLARDGASVIEDASLFGQEWQVLAGTDPDLFLSSNPNQQTAGVCVPPAVSEEVRRRLGEEGIQMEAAEKACAHHKDQKIMDMCIMDVIAMGDLEVAEVNGAY